MAMDLSEVIRHAIASWLERSSVVWPIHVKSDWRESHDSSAPPIFDVNWDVALFVRAIAKDAGDSQLLALAEQLLMEIGAAEAESLLADLADAERAGRELDLCGEARSECIKYFFKEKRYSPDLSKYTMAIEAVRGRGGDATIIASVEKYLDRDKWIEKIYRDVKNEFCRRIDDGRLVSLPTPEEITSECDKAHQDACRRADKTVAERLKKALDA